MLVGEVGQVVYSIAGGQMLLSVVKFGHQRSNSVTRGQIRSPEVKFGQM
jgi:hypothetical protein